MQDLTTEQAEELLRKKRDFAAASSIAEGACTNLKCRCTECTCGAGCTCNISPDVNCDPCKDFKAAMLTKKSGARLEVAEAWYKEKLAQKFADAGVQGIRATEVRSQLAAPGSAPLLLVDCRSDAERGVSTIPGAVAAAAFDADLTMGTGKVVVAFCTVGGRSGNYCKRLLEVPGDKPWVGVKNLELSILDWCHTGGALVDAAGEPTTKVHCWGEQFSEMFPAVGYEIVTEPKPS